MEGVTAKFCRSTIYQVSVDGRAGEFSPLSVRDLWRNGILPKCVFISTRKAREVKMHNTFACYNFHMRSYDETTY